MADDVTPMFKGNTDAPKTSKRSTKSAKAPAKKAVAAKKAATKKAAPSGIVRAKSTVSKEGTHVDEFDGKEYPLSQFPTTKNTESGEMERGHPWVIRKNLPAWREKRKIERAAAKAEADKKAATDKAEKAKAAAQAKAEKEAADKAAKAAAKSAKAPEAQEGAAASA